MDTGLNAYQKKANAKPLWVWFEGNGSSSQTVYEGQGVCYNFDYGTTSERDARRYNRVELPSSGNKAHFAGVLAENYTIPSGGRMVKIYKPGSVCNILVLASENIAMEDNLVCNYGTTPSGLWTEDTETGKGAAVALSTSNVASNALILAVLSEGLQSGLKTG